MPLSSTSSHSDSYVALLSSTSAPIAMVRE